jgi:Flp pilus assembly protein TadD
MTIEAAQQAMRSGQLIQARDLLLELIGTADDKPELRYNLAMLLARLGDFANAAVHFESCLASAPGNPEILNSLGNALRLSGQLQQAQPRLDEAARRAPSHPGILCNRAWLYLARGLFKEAAADFKAVITLSPEIADAHRGLGESLLRLDQLEQACTILQSATEQFPGDAQLHNSLGTAHAQARHPRVAMACYEKALSIDPGNAETLLNHGITAEQLGDLPTAEASLQKALIAKPGYGAAHFHLAYLATHSVTDEEISGIRDSLAKAEIDTEFIDLQFALGKSLAKSGDHEQAFPCFAQARQRMEKQQPFGTDQAIARLETIKTIPHPQATADNVEFVFVIGMPRSGTTLADQILAAHSQVTSLGESGCIGELLQRLHQSCGHRYPDFPAGIPDSSRDQLSAWLLARLKPGQQGQIVVDTSPANFAYLGLLAELLPQARFVHCQRNALDTCVSIFEHPLSQAHGYANSLENLGRYYGAYRSLMNHWQQTLGDRIYTLQYEEVVEQTETVISDLLAHCGLPFEQGCVEFYRSERAILTPSASQVRSPISSRSVGRWKKYEGYLEPLIGALPTE